MSQAEYVYTESETLFLDVCPTNSNLGEQYLNITLKWKQAVRSGGQSVNIMSDADTDDIYGLPSSNSQHLSCTSNIFSQK